MICALCESPAKTRGWCRLHYQRWRRYGDPMRDRPSPIARLAERSTEADGCLVWMGARDQHGYGVIKVDGRARKATRVVWEASYGAIPEGLSVLHACDNPPCISIEHLMLGSQRANVQDALAKGRRPQNRAAA